MSFKSVWIFLFFCYANGQNEEEEILYYEDLINHEIARAYTFPLPENNTFYEPNKDNLNGNLFCKQVISLLSY